jgi:hypothetical protein
MSQSHSATKFAPIQGIGLSKSSAELNKQITSSSTIRGTLKESSSGIVVQNQHRKPRSSTSRESSNNFLADFVETDTRSNTSQVVVIRVHDEGRSLQREFYCNRSLLITEMKYFSLILQDPKTLNVDVRSDLKVFEQLMTYCIHKDIHLEVANVVSVLISCHFLRMDSLEKLCIEFILKHQDKVVEIPIDFGCISTVLIER